nr:hypothetical protein CFP56_48761 [Quercus suber]
MYTFIPHLTATRLQATTYLLGIALFSISFLVFLNSSISFVVTDVIGQKDNVGDAVGTLGFADELIALVACPLWGLLSDRIGSCCSQGSASALEFPHLTATRLQATTYLLGIALFSISFLVFLNSSISFVVTDVIGQKDNVGDAVGTLGFADELIALVACPLWGLLSDRIGVRPVAVAGYCIVGLALVCLVQSENVYPELLLARLGFSIGGAACSTMVTAVLPAMVAQTGQREAQCDEEARDDFMNDHARQSSEGRSSRKTHASGRGHEQTPSLNSELTITQHRYASASQDRADVLHPRENDESVQKAAGTSKLAGFVGLFTGAGALLALAVFLPLPARFQGEGHDPAKSIQISFYIVAAVSFCVAIFIFCGLRNLPGESEKSLSALWKRPYDETTRTDADGNLHITLTPASSYFALIKDAVLLGFTDSAIGLGYVGGFVARASSVGISLFIPLFVNAYFVRSGLCTSNPDNLTDIKENCKKAYTLAAALTGIAETAALICAPLFGWLGGRVVKGRSEWPLFGAATVGLAGYLAFGFLKSPDAFHDRNGRWAFLAVILIGISQIGSIVCSLSLLGRGIQHETQDARVAENRRPDTVDHDVTTTGSEAAPLLPPVYSTADRDGEMRDRAHLKGTIAGVYSFAGGAGILLLTKLGGVLFDSWHVGAPFFMLAIFNGVLMLVVFVVGGGKAVMRKRSD